MSVAALLLAYLLFALGAWLIAALALTLVRGDAASLSERQRSSDELRARERLYPRRPG